MATTEINFIDPKGLDIWIEGPSGNEPAGHLSIGVGNPNKWHRSFGTNMTLSWKYFPLEGHVYEDFKRGGKIISYTTLTFKQTREVMKYFESIVLNKDAYKPSNTCRAFSKKEYNKFFHKYHRVPITPPKRKTSNNPSSNVPWSSSSSVD